MAAKVRLKKLEIYQWYAVVAIYVEDKLIWEGRDNHQLWLPITLMKSLGYELSNKIDLDTHDRHEELNWSDNNWWVPPQTLTELKDQLRRRDLRLQKEKVASLKAQWTQANIRLAEMGEEHDA